MKFIHSEKATEFCEISTNYLTGNTQDKWLMEISQNFLAFSEYMNFTVFFYSRKLKSSIWLHASTIILFQNRPLLFFWFEVWNQTFLQVLTPFFLHAIFWTAFFQYSNNQITKKNRFFVKIWLAWLISNFFADNANLKIF